MPYHTYNVVYKAPNGKVFDFHEIAKRYTSATSPDGARRNCMAWIAELYGHGDRVGHFWGFVAPRRGLARWDDKDNPERREARFTVTEITPEAKPAAPRPNPAPKPARPEQGTLFDNAPAYKHFGRIGRWLTSSCDWGDK